MTIKPIALLKKTEAPKTYPQLLTNPSLDSFSNWKYKYYSNILWMMTITKGQQFSPNLPPTSKCAFQGQCLVGKISDFGQALMKMGKKNLLLYKLNKNLKE